MKTIYSTLFAVVFFTHVATAHVNGLSNGLVFRIKTAQKTTLTDSVFKQYAPVTAFGKHTEAGNFTGYIEAQKALNEAKNKGIKDAEIVAYFNRSRILMEDAFTLMNNRNITEEKFTTFTPEQTDSIINTIRKDDFYFSVEFSLPDGKSVDAFYETIKQSKVAFTPTGLKKYIFGKYYASQEAVQIQNMFVREGITEIMVVAFDETNDRMPVERAFEIEKQILAAQISEIANR